MQRNDSVGSFLSSSLHDGCAILLFLIRQGVLGESILGGHNNIFSCIICQLLMPNVSYQEGNFACAECKNYKACY